MRLHRHLRRPGPSAASLLCRLACALALSAVLAACGSGDTGGPDAGASCTKSAQCAAGEGCISGHCTPLPCGGCQPDEVCQDSGTCTAAQGAKCPTAGCPSGFKCNKNGVCSKPCVLNGDCGDPTLVCNSATGTCAQCLFDSDCTKVAGKPRCDSNGTGNCVACLQPIDCTSALGSGHYCDQTTHACGAGCKSNNDCNLSNGERCDGATTTTPGKCVQCTAVTEAQDCSITAPACDATGKCVICSADKYCGGGTPRCDTTTQTCVECIPAHNATGEDCGYAFAQSVPKDPHDALTCDPAAKKCVNGCAGDTQCGCPIDPNTHQPTVCSRRHSQLHCDPTLTTMPNVAGATLGGCVECVANVDCHCKVKGSTGSTPGCDADWPSLGALNGARCVKQPTSGWGACTEGCDANADCPSGKLCSLSGPTAHTCVECSCAGGVSPDGTWCDDPIGKDLIGGCPLVAGNVHQVCDAKTLTCRLKRQNEICDSSKECGDTTKDASDPTHPWYGQCIPGAQFCVKKAHPYFPVGASDTYCDPGGQSGRCGIACNDPQANTCTAGSPCPSKSNCETATDIAGAPGQYCVSTLCINP